MGPISGAEALVRCLEANKVKYVFGLGGTSVAEILDQLEGHPSIKYILALHEASLVAMADGYARASGETAFVNVHMMPGTANAMSALYTSYRDGTPMVITCGQQETTIAGRNTFTEAPDMTEVTRQFTKWSYEIQRADRVPEIVTRAFKVAATPPTGPVYLTLPKDVLSDKVSVEIPSPENYRVSSRVLPDPEDVKRATDLLLSSSRPIMIVGGEVVKAGAVEDLVRLSELLAMPVFTEAQGSSRLGFPTNHPNYFGRMVGEHPFARDADAVLAIGCPMVLEMHRPHEPIISPKAKVVHVNLDPWEIGKIYQSNVGIVADAKSAASALLSQMESWAAANKNTATRERAEMLREANRLERKAREENLEEDWNAVPIRSRRLAKEISDALGAHGILVNESVTNSGNVVNYGDYADPANYFGSASGCLGWGLPGAMGVKLARPDKPVIACLGDGSFMFSVQSLWTAAHYKIPVVAVVFNNRTYMAIKAFTYRLHGKAAQSLDFVGTDFVDPDISYTHLAQAFGLYGERVERPEDLGPAMERGLSCGKTAIIDVVIDPKELGGGRRLP